MRFLALLLLTSQISFAQISSVQQKALNTYVDYANQSAKEVTSLAQTIFEYYPSLQQKNKTYIMRFVCPVQPDEYFFNKAVLDGKILSSTAITSALKNLRLSAEKIDAKCKELDTYYKLEDYKQDNYVKAKSIVTDLSALYLEYRQKQYDLQSALESHYKKLTANGQLAVYSKADVLMRQLIQQERSLLDSWTFNLQENIHTGWPVDKLETSIPETDSRLANLKKTNISLQYPASSMWTSFQSSLTAFLEEKRRGLDEYNFEAKKSDQHSNDVYLNLINYFNGTLVSDYNTFISFSERDNYKGLKMIQYVPLFELRSEPKTITIDVKPFSDIAHTPISFARQKTPIAKPVYSALANYVDYINETWRQVRYMHMALTSFNSSASYYRSLQSYDRHGALHFDYKDYKIPRSSFQKAVNDSKVLPPAIAKTLNEQGEVIFNILKEMDELSASIEVEVNEKRYEKDHLDKIYSHLERQRVLMETWDIKKEQLYNDVRIIFDAYPAAAQQNSWYVSGTALKTLTDLDRDGLFKAKVYYKGDSTITTVSTDNIETSLRGVIAKEYENMKGIEKYGRSNGLCPYTPYEDLPQTSKSLAEKLKNLKPVKSTTSRHPYEELVYHYNDIVRDYNKFCELSKDVLLLQTVYQPEIFTVKYPEKKKEEVAQNISRTESKPVKSNPVSASDPQVNERPRHTSDVIHDTVYIEKRDTIYLAESGEDVRSMEGYATNNLVLLLDVSGSMNVPEKLPVLKQSVLNMLSMMRQEDEVAIVVFSGKAKILLSPLSFKEEDKIKKAVNNLTSSGKTDGNAGIKLAYKTADENYIRGGNNRIILATDGEFPVGDETKKLVEKFAAQDIFLTIFNFGKSTASSKNLETLATLGKGNYEYISRENVDLKLIREAKGKKKK